jgi:hypothetical protein
LCKHQLCKRASKRYEANDLLPDQSRRVELERSPIHVLPEPEALAVNVVPEQGHDAVLPIVSHDVGSEIGYSPMRHV